MSLHLLTQILVFLQIFFISKNNKPHFQPLARHASNMDTYKNFQFFYLFKKK